MYLFAHIVEMNSYFGMLRSMQKQKVNNEFTCPSCGVRLTKRDCQNAVMTVFNENLKTTHTMSRQVPVLINYLYAGKRYEKNLMRQI